MPGLDLFVLSSASVFDVSAEHLRNLEVQECFSGLVPLLFFLRHCEISLPAGPLRWAHWIIDDPNLRPRYGFLDLKALARCVQETGVAASIAFIPWNHKRTSKEIVDLFRNNWPRLSVCVHGCDHTGSEFSTRSIAETTPLIDLAMKRMKRLEEETSLGFDPVMVFPQGRFSGEAMRALRASEMLAAVNTELLDCQTGSGVKGGELLKPVITSFGGFPLFMRRRAEDSAANFALDLMLGKPVLIVTHHQYFEHGLASFRSVVKTLNALEPNLAWINLERGILSTYSVSRDSDDNLRLRLYGARTEFIPHAGDSLIVSKAETGPDSVEVFVDGRRVATSSVNGDVQFAVKAAVEKTMVIEARGCGCPAATAVSKPEIPAESHGPALSYGSERQLPLPVSKANGASSFTSTIDSEGPLVGTDQRIERRFKDDIGKGIPFVDLVAPHLELQDELMDAVKGVLTTGMFVGGPMVENFEHEFARFANAKHCVAVSSGTDALRFILIAAGFGKTTSS